MKRTIGAILGIAATAATPADAQFCAEVNEIVAGAREAEPFASFPQSLTMKGRPMLGFGVCGRDDGGFSCWGYGNPQPWESVEELAAMVAGCLPQATVTDSGLRINQARTNQSPRVPRFGSRTIYVDSGTLRFEVVFQFNPRTNTTKLLVYER